MAPYFCGSFFFRVLPDATILDCARVCVILSRSHMIQDNDTGRPLATLFTSPNTIKTIWPSAHWILSHSRMLKGSSGCMQVRTVIFRHVVFIKLSFMVRNCPLNNTIKQLEQTSWNQENITCQQDRQYSFQCKHLSGAWSDLECNPNLVSCQTNTGPAPLQMCHKALWNWSLFCGIGHWTSASYGTDAWGMCATAPVSCAGRVPVLLCQYRTAPRVCQRCNGAVLWAEKGA